MEIAPQALENIHRRRDSHQLYSGNPCRSRLWDCHAKIESERCWRFSIAWRIGNIQSNAYAFRGGSQLGFLDGYCGGHDIRS